MSPSGPEFNPAMEPVEPVTPFEVARTSERAGLLKLVIGFGLLATFVFIGIKIYQPGVRDRADPPLITAENTPFKIVPDDPGGMQTPDQDKEVFDVMAGQQPSTDIVTLPPPETPVDRPVVSTPDPEPVEPEPVVIDPTPTPGPAPAVRDPAPAPQPIPPAASSSDWVVQVASLRSQAEAEATYARIRGSHGAIIGSYPSDIARVDLAEKGIYYRARVGGFDSRASASGVCDRLKAAGQSCFVARR
ncbi:MAG: SPOR domain-containing protein [Pseudomonadota bacterium]